MRFYDREAGETGAGKPLPIMPNSNEESLPPAAEAAPTPASAPVDSVSEVNDQLASAKLSDHDEAPPVDEAKPKPKEHPELWKPQPPTEECPVCMVPLALAQDKSMYWACCGKIVCCACCEEHDRALRVTNRKREKKKQAPLEETCAFCRSPLHEDDSELISRYGERIEKGDTVAMTNLAYMNLHGSDGLRKDEAKAFELFQMAADLGSAEATGMLGRFLAEDRFTSTPNTTKGQEYFEDAAAKGHIASRYHLAVLLADEGHIDLAIKHLHLAAAAGHDNSMKALWECFSKGKLSKPDLEKALRTLKAACDEMNSEERERLAAFREAMDGNDGLLKKIYSSYYMGFINAKELKKLLKAHAAGDRGAVETLLNMKIPLKYK